MNVELKEKGQGLLSNLQKKLINRKNQNVEFKKHVFDTEIDRSKNESTMKIEKMKLAQEETEADLQVEIEKLRAQPIKNALARMKNQNDFNNIQNEIRKREILNLVKQGKKLGKLSLLCSIFSGIMTSISIVKLGGLNVYTLFQTIIIVCCACMENILLKNWNKYYNDFYENSNKIKNVIFYLMSLGIVIYTAYSIKTNYEFWSGSSIDSFGRAVISVIFDLMSVVFAFVSDEYFYLNFNKNKFKDTTKDIDINSLIVKAKLGGAK